MQNPSVFTALKEQSFIVSALIVWFGFSSVSGYYAKFGIRYYSLDIPYSHLIIRGITSSLFNWKLFLLYIFLFCVIYISHVGLQFRYRNFTFKPIIYFPVILISSIWLGNFLAINASRETAVNDMYSSSTNLRKLKSFNTNNTQKKVFINYYLSNRPVLILYSSDRYLLIFQEPSIKSINPEIPVTYIPIQEGDFYETEPTI
jgi:hypothetical protein